MASSNCAITDNFANNGEGGIVCRSTTNLTLNNCTLANNVRMGIAIYGDGSIIINSCIVWHPQGGDIWKIIEASPVINASYSTFKQARSGPGNSTSDPLFVDSTNASVSKRNYHLLPNSPCIDAGDPGGNYTGQTDIDGDLRVMNGRVDMGSDEALVVTETIAPGEILIINPSGGPNDPNTKALVVFDNQSAGSADVNVAAVNGQTNPSTGLFSALGKTLTIETSLADYQFFMTLTIPFSKQDLVADQKPKDVELLYWNKTLNKWVSAVSGNKEWPFNDPLHTRIYKEHPLNCNSAPTLTFLQNRGLGANGVFWDTTTEKGFVWANVEHTSDFAAFVREIADLDLDGNVNLTDFSLLGLHWQESDCNSSNNWCGGADADCNGQVNWSDLKEITDKWLKEPELPAAVSLEWAARYDGPAGQNDEALDFAIDWMGNVYVTGKSYNPGSGYDYATVKYDCDGNQVWENRYDGPAHNLDEGHAVALDGVGNAYVTGYSYGDIATIKYDPDGNEVWVRRYNGPGNNYDSGDVIALDGAGNVYVAGYSYLSGQGNNCLVIKYDPNGNQLWVANYNGPGNSYDGVTAIFVDVSGNVYFTGHSDAVGPNRDYITVKYDTNGTQRWVARYNGTGNGFDYANAITVDDSGDVYVTGYSSSGTNYDYATVKYDPNGNEVWARRYNGPGNGSDYAQDVAVDYARNVYVTGYSVGDGSGSDYATIKYDPNGNEVWVKRYNGPGNNTDEAQAIVLDSVGNIYVTGRSKGADGRFGYVTIGYDTNGNTWWEERYNRLENSIDEAKKVLVDFWGNVYVTGKSYTSTTSNDYVTIKYCQ